MLSPYAQNAFEGQLRRTGIVRPPNTDIPNGPVDRNTTGPIGAMPVNSDQKPWYMGPGQYVGGAGTPFQNPSGPGGNPVTSHNFMDGPGGPIGTMPPNVDLPPPGGRGMGFPNLQNWGPNGPIGVMPHQNPDNMPAGDPRFPIHPALPLQHPWGYGMPHRARNPGMGDQQGYQHGAGNMYGRLRASDNPGPLSAWQWGS